MFSRLQNLAICELQKLATAKYGDTIHTANIVREFTKLTNQSGKISDLETIKREFITRYNLDQS